MKVNYYNDVSMAENHVDVYYRRKDAEVENIMLFFNDEKILYGKNEREQRRLHLKEIYYVEVVERRCFVYLKTEVYEIGMPLREFLERHTEYGFIQIGKAVAVNLNRIEKILPDFNMRMNLTLENGHWGWWFAAGRLWHRQIFSICQMLQSGTIKKVQ